VRVQNVRKPDGSLSGRTHGEIRALIAELPLIDVERNTTVTVADLGS
jgi:hypothetical protein